MSMQKYFFKEQPTTVPKAPPTNKGSTGNI